jgi:hypothetical protein
VLRGAVAHRNGEKFTRSLYKTDQSPMPINFDGSIPNKN